MVILNGHVVDPETGLNETADLIIENDIIKDVLVHSKGEKYNDNSNAQEVVDATGTYVMPGFIDLHVHFRDPGLTYKEDIETGAKAAARGGVTTVCTMPNTKPVVDSVETIEYIYKKANEKADINIKQLSAITKGMMGDELVDMEAMKRAGAIAFSEDSLVL